MRHKYEERESITQETKQRVQRWNMSVARRRRYLLDFVMTIKTILGNLPVHCEKHANTIMEISDPTHGNKYPVRCEKHAHSEDKSLLSAICYCCNLECIIDSAGRCYFCNPERQQTVRLAKPQGIKLPIKTFHH